LEAHIFDLCHEAEDASDLSGARSRQNHFAQFPLGWKMVHRYNKSKPLSLAVASKMVGVSHQGYGGIGPCGQEEKLRAGMG
jgi:hypothetical protein